jgi:hypothetical protein
MTKEEKNRVVSALLVERSAYEARSAAALDDKDDAAFAAAQDRLAQVDAELKKLGAQAKKPSEQASRRPSAQPASKR